MLRYYYYHRQKGNRTPSLPRFVLFILMDQEKISTSRARGSVEFVVCSHFRTISNVHKIKCARCATSRWMHNMIHQRVMKPVEHSHLSTFSISCTDFKISLTKAFPRGIAVVSRFVKIQLNCPKFRELIMIMRNVSFREEKQGNFVQNHRFQLDIFMRSCHLYFNSNSNIPLKPLENWIVCFSLTFIAYSRRLSKEHKVKCFELFSFVSFNDHRKP